MKTRTTKSSPKTNIDRVCSALEKLTVAERQKLASVLCCQICLEQNRPDSSFRKVTLLGEYLGLEVSVAAFIGQGAHAFARFMVQSK